jgi:phage terminase large subunit
MVAAAHAAGVQRAQLERFIRAGIVLTPKQFKAAALARQCDLPGGPSALLFGGARGGGKSHWSLAQLIEDCMLYPGLACLFLRQVGKAARESFEKMRKVILAGVEHSYDPHHGIVRFPNSSEIRLGNFSHDRDINKYLGIEYDVILVEEATMLTPEKIKDIRTCNRTSKAGWRPRMYYTTNPGGVSHNWFKREFIEPFRAGTETSTRYIPATVDDNPLIDADYERVNLASLTGWKLRAWRYGDWDIAAGQFFTTFVRGIHVVDPFELPDTWTMWGALDYGFRHYTAAYLFAQDNDGTVYVTAEHGERKWLPERHAEAIKGMAGRIAYGIHNLHAFYAGADIFAQRGGTHTIAKTYADNGINLTVADNDRINGAARMLELLGDPADDNRPLPPRMFIFSTCVRLIDSLPIMVHDPHRPEDVLKVDCDDEGNGGDDWYDACRYGLMAARLGGASVSPLVGYRG